MVRNNKRGLALSGFTSIFLLTLLLGFSSCGPKVDYAKQMLVEDVVATSTKEEAKRPDWYSPYFLLDGNGASSWCEGKEDYGVNESVYIKLKQPIRFNKIMLYNGKRSGAAGSPYLSGGQKSTKTADASFNDNPTISHLFISSTLISGKKKTVSKLDKAVEIPSDKAYQEISLPKTLSGSEIQLQIKVYNPVKGKSWRKDVCMSEVRFGFEDKENPKESISSYPVAFEYNSVIVDWEKFKTNKLQGVWQYISFNSYYKLLLESPDFRAKRGMELVVADNQMEGGDIRLKKGEQFEILFSKDLDKNEQKSATDHEIIPEKMKVVAEQGALLYMEADTNSAIRATLPKGESVDILQRSNEKKTIKGNMDYMYLVQWQEQKGWLAASDLSAINAPANEAVSQEDNEKPVDVIYQGTYKPMRHNETEGLQAQFIGNKTPESSGVAGDSHFNCIGYIKYLRSKEELDSVLAEKNIKKQNGRVYVHIRFDKDNCEDGQPPQASYIKILAKK